MHVARVKTKLANVYSKLKQYLPIVGKGFISDEWDDPKITTKSIHQVM